MSNRRDDRARRAGRSIDSEAWRVRVGQIETVLSFFGTMCSVSVDSVVTEDSSAADTVYVQARRVDGGLELEMTGNTYLAHGQLTQQQHERMVELGWRLPDRPASPNFTRWVAAGDDVHEVAVGIAQAFAEVYGVVPEAEWVVSPPEFDNEVGGLSALAPEDDGGEGDAVDDAMAGLRRVLAEGSGAVLVSAILRQDVSWQALVDAGLPRGDQLAEMAMLHRPDCPVAFLRASRFRAEVLKDPTLPAETVDAVLSNDPSPWELKCLATRADIDPRRSVAAAVRGAKLAHWRGRTARYFLELALVPPAFLRRLSDQHDEDAVGMLRHPRCPEDVVLKHVLARSARVRHAALRATQQRGLAVDSELVRLAGTVPMTERPNTPFPYAPRVRSMVEQILAAR